MIFQSLILITNSIPGVPVTVPVTESLDFSQANNSQYISLF